MKKASAVTGLVDYERLSCDTVRQMHQKFIEGVEERARNAVPAGVPDAEILAGSLKSLFIACARKAIEIKPDELVTIAGGGENAVRKKISEVQQAMHARSSQTWYAPSPFFSKKQELGHALARLRRVDDPAVLRVFGGEQRIYLRMKGVVSEVQENIAAHLETRGYRITDYKGGYATDEKGKQQFRIGKLLKEQTELYNAFMNDSSRTFDNLLVVISRDADDIAAMSTGRAWNSCMGSGGIAYNYVHQEIRKGSLIAYLVSEKDPDINNPLARILIRPFRKKESGLSSVANVVFWRQPEQIFVPGKIYGLSSEIFSVAVKAFVEEKLNAGKEGSFVLVKGLYDDIGSADRYKRENETTVPDPIPVIDRTRILRL